MAIDFPNSPNNGDSFTSNDKTWQYNGTSWVVIAGSVSIDAGSVTASKLANNAVTSAKIDAGAVTQAKLAASLSGVTVTTTANRSTAVPSPFTGQLVFLTDVTRLQVWNGSAWTFITNGAPGAPTALSATALSTTSVSVAFTPGTINGASPINYKYSLSTNGGSTYGEPIALDPADNVSPVTISGLTGGQTYHIKLRAVSDFGDSPDSTATSIAVPTLPSAPTSLSATGEYLAAEITFTPGADGGSAITNYQYAFSTNNGATYSSFTALNPADATSPIRVTGLANTTTHLIKLKAVTAFGVSAESSPVSVTTVALTARILLIAGGGGGGNINNGGRGSAGGAGGLIHIDSFPIVASGVYSISIAGATALDTQGSNSTFSGQSRTLTALGGGRGLNNDNQTPQSGGSGGGGWYPGGTPGAATQPSTTNDGVNQWANTGFGNPGGQSGSTQPYGSGGGGAGGAGANFNAVGGGAGGIGKQYDITGVSTYYAGGGSSAGYPPQGGYVEPPGGLGGGGTGSNDATDAISNGQVNSGGGGGSGGTGGSGVLIVRYPSALTMTIGPGLTGSTSTVGASKVTTITAGSGNVSWA